MIVYVLAQGLLFVLGIINFIRDRNQTWLVRLHGPALAALSVTWLVLSLINDTLLVRWAIAMITVAEIAVILSQTILLKRSSKAGRS